jgi:hypothetical protein
LEAQLPVLPTKNNNKLPSEANVSMIKLIHNIWIGLSTSCFITAAPIKVSPTATTFTVN